MTFLANLSSFEFSRLIPAELGLKLVLLPKGLCLLNFSCKFFGFAFNSSSFGFIPVSESILACFPSWFLDFFATSHWSSRLLSDCSKLSSLASSESSASKLSIDRSRSRSGLAISEALSGWWFNSSGGRISGYLHQL